MTKPMSLCLLVLWVLGASCATFAHDPIPVISPYVIEPPEIDGDLSDWDLSKFIHVTPENSVFDPESGSTDDPENLSFSFGVANDKEYLYVAVMITDDILVLDTNPDPSDKEARAWMDDAVEIFLDGDHSHSPDARDPEGVEFKTGGEFSIVANGAVTSTMSGVPRMGGDPRYWTSAGSTIGFTVSAHDDDDGGGRDAALYWKGLLPHCWKNEAGWGDLLLSTPTSVEPTTYGKIKAGFEVERK